MKKNGRFLLAGGAIVAVALALRLHHVGAEELWLDEAFTFRDVTVPGWLGDLRLKDVPPLYPLLLHAWIGLAGAGEAGLRALSALSGTLAVVATMWTAVEMFDRRVALWSGLWAAVAPMAVYYSQEARPYALVAALTATAYAALWRAFRRDGIRDWALAILVLAALLYSHYLAGLIVVPTATMLLAWPGIRRARRWAAAVGAAVVLFLPWVAWSFVATAHPVTGVDWIAEAWQRTRLAVPTSLELLVLGSEKGRVPIALKQFDVLIFPAPLRVLGLATLALCGLWLVAPGSGRDAAGRNLARRKVILAALVLGPLLALWTVSWWKPMYLAGRYDSLAFPGVALALGVAFATLPRRIAGLAALALVVTIGAKLVLYYRQPVDGREPNRETATKLVGLVHDGDLVVFTGLRGYGVVYQLARREWTCGDGACEAPSGGRFSARTFPRPLGPLPTQRDVDRVANAPDVIRADLDEDLAAAGTPARVLVVLGAWGTQDGSFAVAPDDGLFLQQLVRAGYAVASVDVRLGIVEYRRGGAAP